MLFSASAAACRTPELGSLSAASSAGTAYAGLIPTAVTVAPEGGNFRWTYAVVLPSDMKLQAGDYFGIYNFHGLVPGTGSAPDGWSLSTPAVSTLSPNVTIFDDPDAPNLVWTYAGPTIPAGQLGLGNFWASSRYGSGEQSLFVGRNARSGDGAYDTNITDTPVPSGTADAPPGVPEPASLVLAGLGLRVPAVAAEQPVALAQAVRCASFHRCPRCWHRRARYEARKAAEGARRTGAAGDWSSRLRAEIGLSPDGRGQYGPPVALAPHRRGSAVVIQFDAHCPTCRRGFKAEAAAPPDGKPTGQFRCTCPRCQTAVILRCDAGTPAAQPSGWALEAAPCDDEAKTA